MAPTGTTQAAVLFSDSLQMPGAASSSRGSSTGSTPRSGATSSGLCLTDILGSWLDLDGNPVQVSSSDAFTVRPVATICRPDRSDLHLAIRPHGQGGWCCGRAVLDTAASSQWELHWHFPNSPASVWTRRCETMDKWEDGATGLGGAAYWADNVSVSMVPSNDGTHLTLWVPCWLPKNAGAGYAN